MDQRINGGVGLDRNGNLSPVYTNQSETSNSVLSAKKTIYGLWEERRHIKEQFISNFFPNRLFVKLHSFE